VRWLDTWLDTALAYGLCFVFPDGGRKTVANEKEKESDTQSGVEPPHSKMRAWNLSVAAGCCVE
jgi:hypothetical protein